MEFDTNVKIDIGEMPIPQIAQAEQVGESKVTSIQLTNQRRAEILNKLAGQTFPGDRGGEVSVSRDSKSGQFDVKISVGGTSYVYKFGGQGEAIDLFTTRIEGLTIDSESQWVEIRTTALPPPNFADKVLNRFASTPNNPNIEK